MPSEGPTEFDINMIFRLTNKRSPKEVSLKSLEWAVITQVNGEKTVAQIGETLALNQVELEEIFSRLVSEGLLEFVESKQPDTSPSPAFIKELERQFKLCVGPIADIILNDTLAELKTSRQYLEKEQIPLLVELLSLQISSEKKRTEFQKEMLIEIKGIFNGSEL